MLSEAQVPAQLLRSGRPPSYSTSTVGVRRSSVRWPQRRREGWPGAAEEPWEGGRAENLHILSPSRALAKAGPTGSLHVRPDSAAGEDCGRSDFPPLPSSSELVANLPKQRCGQLILQTQGRGGCRSWHPPLYLVPRRVGTQEAEGVMAAEMCWGPFQSGEGSWVPHRLKRP